MKRSLISAAVGLVLLCHATGGDAKECLVEFEDHGGATIAKVTTESQRNGKCDDGKWIGNLLRSHNDPKNYNPKNKPEKKLVHVTKVEHYGLHHIATDTSDAIVRFLNKWSEVPWKLTQFGEGRIVFESLNLREQLDLSDDSDGYPPTGPFRSVVVGLKNVFSIILHFRDELNDSSEVLKSTPIEIIYHDLVAHRKYKLKQADWQKVLLLFIALNDFAAPTKDSSGTLSMIFISLDEANKEVSDDLNNSVRNGQAVDCATISFTDSPESEVSKESKPQKGMGNGLCTPARKLYSVVPTAE